MGELDQINKIHNVIGTPPPETLAKLKKHSNSHIDFNFPHKEGSSLQKLIPHISSDWCAAAPRLTPRQDPRRPSAQQRRRLTPRPPARPPAPPPLAARASSPAHAAHRC